MVEYLISDCLKGQKPTFSVEFFPPKDEAGAELIMETASVLKEHVRPDYVSITYGADGSTRERTFQYACLLKDYHGFTVMPHLTCVGASHDEIIETVSEYERSGFRNLMALRGDPPKGSVSFTPHPDGPKYASELVSLLNKHFPNLCLGVAGYPETHPEASSSDDDLDHLKHKVDQGASFITTQLFYNNDRFHHFVERCRERGITVPIIPGLMPLFSVSAARRFCRDIPPELDEKLDAAAENREAIEAIGIDWAYYQIKDLFRHGVPGVHLYIMNRSQMVVPLVKRLRASGLL